MRLNFLQLFIANFKSFKGEHGLKLDVPVGVHFVRGVNRAEPRLGANGTGKSSLWDALVWCLYGRTPNGLKNPDVTPWVPGPSTKVGLLIAIGDQRHTINRTIAPNLLELDGEPCGQAKIDKLVGMSFDVMTNTIILGQGRPLFFDMSAADKMALLSEVKNLDRWDTRSKAASDRITKVLEPLRIELEAEVHGYKTALSELRTTLHDAQHKSETWDQEQQARVVVGDREQRKASVALLKLQDAVAGLDLKHDGAMVEVKACERQINQLSMDMVGCATRLQEARDKRASLKSQALDLLASIDAVGHSRVCPTCKQPIKSGQLKEHVAEIQRAIAKMHEARSAIKVVPLKAALETVRSNMEHAQRYLQSFTAKADGAMSEYKLRQAELVTLESQIKTWDALRDQGDNPYSKDVREIFKRKRVLVANMTSARVDLERTERRIVRTSVWIKGFKEIRLQVLEEFLQELELACAATLEEVGLIGWQIKFALERETKSGTTRRALHVWIGSPTSGKKLVRWESWSGGEGQRLRVVGALALSSVLLNHANVTPSMEVLDEPTQHLSPPGIIDLCATLTERARTHRRRIFYCDHQSIDGAQFESTILVKRSAGKGSRIIRSVGYE